LLSYSFGRLRARRRNFTDRGVSRGNRRCLGLRCIVRSELWRMAPGDYRRSSEDLLRQSDFVIIAVVVFRHLRVPLISQLSSSTMNARAETTPWGKQGHAGV
jgi:hypothetical protein